MNSEKAFTLVELLVVITIIGILAAIAIPQFTQIRAKSFNSNAESLLANIAQVQEVYHSDHETYTGDLTTLDGMDIVDLLSTDVVIGLAITFSAGMFCDIPPEGPSDQWWGYTYHPKGDYRFCFDSSAGGMTKVEGSDTSCF